VGKDLAAARFSPDGRTIALGFDTTVVQLLESATLSEVARPSTEGVDNGNLCSVAWSADGTHLVAAGMWGVGVDEPRLVAVRRWPVRNLRHFNDIPAVDSTITDLVAFSDGMLFASAEPTWGILGDDRVRWQKAPVIADYRAWLAQLRVSDDGRRVRFGYGSQDACIFDLGSGGALGPDDPTWPVARYNGPEVKIDLGQPSVRNPTLNGKVLKVDPLEPYRCWAISPDGSRVAMGSDWSLSLFDREGTEVWRKPASGFLVAVWFSGDCRFVVAGCGDGTIRWHAVSDGNEVLAFFPHADRKRWIAWTPEGFFSASRGSEDLIGYHLNRGKDREGEFISARQLWEIFYQPGLIAHRLDTDGDERIATAVKQSGDVRELLRAEQNPELELVSPSEAQSHGPYTLQVRVKKAGIGKGRLVVRVAGEEIKARWQGPALTPGGLITLPVDLAAGKRSVSVELVDARGVGSRPVEAQVTVRRAIAPTNGTLHVLTVGITNYFDGALKLKYPAADARALAAQLEERGKALFHGHPDVRTLVDNEATLDKIKETGDLNPI
jgi:WD40 repeat protein